MKEIIFHIVLLQFRSQSSRQVPSKMTRHKNFSIGILYLEFTVPPTVNINFKTPQHTVTKTSGAKLPEWRTAATR
jgi:hypothetical protein